MARAKDSVIQVKISQELKNEAEELFEDIGLDIPSAIRLFIKQSVIAGTLPFQIRRSGKTQSDTYEEKQPVEETEQEQDTLEEEIEPEQEISEQEEIERRRASFAATHKAASKTDAIINDLY